MVRIMNDSKGEDIYTTLYAGRWRCEAHLAS